MTYDNTVYKTDLAESAIIAQFLADAHPSHLLPASHSTPTAPLTRARIAFFVDTLISHIYGRWFALHLSPEPAETKAAKARVLVREMAAEIEPLLADAAPFFGGSDRLTLAECLTAPFVLRVYAFARAGPGAFKVVVEELEALPGWSKWVKALRENESVRASWDERGVLEKSARKNKARAERVRMAAEEEKTAEEKN